MKKKDIILDMVFDKEYTVGRLKEKCMLFFSEDEEMSRFHAILKYTNDNILYIEDNFSSNGYYILYN